MAHSNNYLFPAANSPQRQGGSGNATGSGRNKVALPKGRSLMDWIRLGNSGEDLTGVGGRLVRVTPDELKKHNTQDDCWTAINGAVYNITRYCEFHPGGVDEIMKAAGKDGTRLFNEVHRWVNFSSMLRKCLVGKLVSEGIFNRAPQYGNLLAPPRAMGTNLATVNKPQVADASSDKRTTQALPFTKPTSPDKPRFDYFQTDRAVKLVVYTRTAEVGTHSVVLERPGANVRISVRLPFSKTYRLHFAPSHPLLLSSHVKAVETVGKVEIDFIKSERDVKWTRLGDFLAQHDSLLTGPSGADGSAGACTTQYIDCTLSELSQLTHDTRLYVFSLPEGYHMGVPIGHHVKVKASILGMDIERSYTPVLCQAMDKDGALPYETLVFIIKIYSDGALTQYLCSLQPGDVIPVSHPIGEFRVAQMESHTRVLLLAAGTGFTPMSRLIAHCVSHDRQVHLVFFNKSQTDIFWREELEELVKRNPHLLKVTHALSLDDPTWRGLSGRLTSQMLEEFLPTADRSQTFVGACGPIPFIQLCQRLLSEISLDSKQYHLFQE